MTEKRVHLIDTVRSLTLWFTYCGLSLSPNHKHKTTFGLLEVTCNNCKRGIRPEKFADALEGKP